MSVSNNKVILRFANTSFAYNDGKKIILEDTSFSLRENTKITIMGQNGAGKSTMFKLIMGELTPTTGKIFNDANAKIAIARQVIPREKMELSVREWYQQTLDEEDYSFDKKIAKVLQEVNLTVPDLDKKLKDFSWGQQARLLLGYALIQDPDILLLDEPTNNLDTAWIGDLISFLMMYEKTVVVISHDADFLNMFTDGVLYLNVMKHKVEQYRWDYYNVQDKIIAQVEKEEKQNARAKKQIADAKGKIAQFSQKWGKMRKLAKKMRAQVADAEDDLVEVRRDDKTINTFTIDFENYVGPIVTINNVSLMNKMHVVEHHPLDLQVKKKERYILEGPNGIGKTTLLKRLVHAHDEDATIHDWVRVGYYSQDFNALDMNMKVWDALHEVNAELTDEQVYKTAAWFLLRGDLLKNTIGSLSEWQKWLLCYARFVLQKPHLLIMDEPTNHINFRHLPIIADALNDYQGALIMVSHDQEFVRKMNGLQTINLGKLMK